MNTKNNFVTETKICGQCQLQVAKYIETCPVCGCQQFFEADGMYIQSDGASETKVQQSEKRKRTWNIPLIALGGILSVVFLIVIFTVMLSKDTRLTDSNMPEAESAHFMLTDLEEKTDVTIDNIHFMETGKVYSQTIMIYMVGSDLETEGGAATSDIAEMLAAEFDSEMHNVLVLVGGAKNWQNEVLPGQKNILFRIANGQMEVLEETEAENMGAAETLSGFIRYGISNYETDKYGLILWDHGAGPVIGYGYDEIYEDVLELSELKEALEQSVGNTERKLEWIGFDACIMDNMEVADCISEYADYMVASQETEPGWGWYYDFLSILSQPDVNGQVLCACIAEYYYAFGQAVFEQYPQYYADLTMAVLDLGKVEELESALNDFFKGQAKRLDVEGFAKTSRKQRQAKSFASFSTNYDYGLLDLKSLVTALEAAEAQKVTEIIDEMLIYMRSNVKDANGISICCPCNTEEDYAEKYMKSNDMFGFAPDYTKYVRSYQAIKNGERILDAWDVSKAKSGVSDLKDEDGKKVGSDITLQLTKEQQKNFSHAKFMILGKASGLKDADADSGDEYYMVHIGEDTELDKNGVLHAYYGDKVLYISDDNQNKSLMLLLQDSSSDSEKRYTFFTVLTWIDTETLDSKVTRVNIQLAVNDENPDGIIRNAFSAEEDNYIPGKQLIDIQEYNYLSFISGIAKETRDENGKILPYGEWEDTGSSAYAEVAIDSMQIEAKEIEDPENYFCMFYIYDAQGNRTVSELVPLKK